MTVKGSICWGLVFTATMGMCSTFFDKTAPLEAKLSLSERPFISLTKGDSTLLTMGVQDRSCDAAAATFSSSYPLSIPDEFEVTASQDFSLEWPKGQKKEYFPEGYYARDNTTERIDFYRSLVSFTLKGREGVIYHIRLSIPREKYGQYAFEKVAAHNFLIKRKAIPSERFKKHCAGFPVLEQDTFITSCPDDFIVMVSTDYKDRVCFEKARLFFPTDPQ